MEDLANLMRAPLYKETINPEEGAEMILRILYKDHPSPLLEKKKPIASSVSKNFIDVKPLESEIQTTTTNDIKDVVDIEAKRESKDHPAQSVVIFNVIAETNLGEELYICGNHELLGQWNPNKALKLSTDSQSYPHWTLTLIIPGQSPLVEYKYIIQDNNRSSCKWEYFDGNRKLDLLSDWEFVDDGIFGKLNQQIVNTQVVESLRRDVNKQRELVAVEVEEKQKLQTELDKSKEKIAELEHSLNQIKKQIAIFEGAKFDCISTPDLKALAGKSKKTAQRANAEIAKRLEDEAYHLRRLRDCAVCMDSPIDTVCLPCGHLSLCSECAVKLHSRCVICNAKIQSIQKVFFK